MSSTTAVNQQFMLHTKLFNNVLSGITDEQAEVQLTEHINHLRWIAGHLTNIRYNVSTMMGVQKPFPFHDLYVDMTQPPPHNRKLDTALQYPTLSELKTCWDEISPIFTGAISNLSAEQLAMPLPFRVPTGDTFFDALNFMGSHEAYHIGQMSIIRRHLGLDAMSYQ
ncbi:MAG TPA: DinB family protein [Chitinophagaceae bacterium]|nr:DinB family protein [Chitinophagaceae bacterium]